MRSMILFFIALSASVIGPAAMSPHFGVAGAAGLIDRSSEVIITVDRHLRGRQIADPTARALAETESA